MDSLTQFALGAAVGELVLGKQLGWKAILLGGIAGTIPDLDVFLNSFFDPLVALKIHRGFSHSIFFALIFGPFFGWLSHKVSKKASFQRWSLMWFLGFLTHALLDCCTTYGTQLFNPVSDYLVAFDNIFVVDPLYTIPLFLGVVVALFYFRNRKMQRRVNLIGFGLSCLYMLWTFGAQGVAKKQFAEALEKQGISYTRLQVTPTPMNSILWEGIAQDKDQVYFGNYSVLDKREDIVFRPKQRNTELLEPYKETLPVQTALWFSTGLYCAEKIGDVIHIYTTKFGPMNLDGPVEFIFPMVIKPLANGTVEYVPDEEFPEGDEMKEMMGLIWERLWGI